MRWEQGLLSIKLSMITRSHFGESQAELPGFLGGLVCQALSI